MNERTERTIAITLMILGVVMMALGASDAMWWL